MQFEGLDESTPLNMSIPDNYGDVPAPAAKEVQCELIDEFQSNQLNMAIPYNDFGVPAPVGPADQEVVIAQVHVPHIPSDSVNENVPVPDPNRSPGGPLPPSGSQPFDGQPRLSSNDQTTSSNSGHVVDSDGALVCQPTDAWDGAQANAGFAPTCKRTKIGVGVASKHKGPSVSDQTLNAPELTSLSNPCPGPTSATMDSGPIQAEDLPNAQQPASANQGKKLHVHCILS